MNVELLQKTRDSVADENLIFNMLSWSDCICGHAARIAGIGRPSSIDWPSVQPYMHAVTAALGMDLARADALFGRIGLSRAAAVLVLDNLIAEAQATQPVEPERIPPELDPDPDELEQEETDPEEKEEAEEEEEEEAEALLV